MRSVGRAVAGNAIINNRFNRPVQMAGTSDNWTVTNNRFYDNGNNIPALVGANNSVFNNDGVNPQGGYAAGDIAGSATFNRVNGSMQTATLTGIVGPVTITAGQNVGDELTLVLTQDATGGRTFAWPTNAKLAGGVLTLSVTPNAVDVVRLAWDAQIGAKYPARSVSPDRQVAITERKATRNLAYSTSETFVQKAGQTDARPVTGGRSFSVTMPGAAATTAGTALVTGIAV